MSLKDLFAPRWRHPDPAVRIKAIKKVKFPSQLEQIIYEDDSREVRDAAMERLSRLKKKKVLVREDEDNSSSR